MTTRLKSSKIRTTLTWFKGFITNSSKLFINTIKIIRINMKKKRKFNRNNCHEAVRAIIKTDDVTIILCGRHGFEWSIVRESNNTFTMTSFTNRIEAKKNWNEIKKQYKKEY